MLSEIFIPAVSIMVVLGACAAVVLFLPDYIAEMCVDRLSDAERSKYERTRRPSVRKAKISE